MLKDIGQGDLVKICNHLYQDFQTFFQVTKIVMSICKVCNSISKFV